MKLKLAVSFLFFSLSFCALSEEVKVKKLSKTKWAEAASENFILLTNANNKKANEMATELEEFRHFIALLLGHQQVETNKKIQVILSKNNSTFKAFGIKSNFSGIFVQDYTSQVIFSNGKGFSSSSDGKSNRGRQIILHELTHLLMNNASIGLASPLWYSEGIAEYFGTYKKKMGIL